MMLIIHVAVIWREKSTPRGDNNMDCPALSRQKSNGSKIQLILTSTSTSQIQQFNSNPTPSYHLPNTLPNAAVTS